MRRFTLSEFIPHVAGLAARAELRRRHDLDWAAKVVQGRAKAIIGHYQDDAGPFAGWAQLAPATIEEKERLGYAPPDNPLLREGDLRDSIGRTVISSREAVVGSNSPVAVAQELGTSRIPPRSFLGAAAVQSIDKVAAIIGEGAVMTLEGREVFGGSIQIEP